jgi:hypothetical protein
MIPRFSARQRTIYFLFFGALFCVGTVISVFEYGLPGLLVLVPAGAHLVAGFHALAELRQERSLSSPKPPVS